MKNRKFFDTETRHVVTLEELRAIYESDSVLQEEYDTFGKYLACCQSAENGTLVEIYETIHENAKGETK